MTFFTNLKSEPHKFSLNICFQNYELPCAIKALYTQEKEIGHTDFPVNPNGSNITQV